MSEHYNKQGNPIGLMEWAGRLESERRVRETTLPNGQWVSTVWLGLDHSFGFGNKPLIFETMVFANQHDMGDLDCDRYSTEAEAIAGHEAMCAKWTNKKSSDTE